MIHECPRCGWTPSFLYEGATRQVDSVRGCRAIDPETGCLCLIQTRRICRQCDRPVCALHFNSAHGPGNRCFGLTERERQDARKAWVESRINAEHENREAAAAAMHAAAASRCYGHPDDG